MELVELNNQDKEFYNNFITSHETGSFLQSWAWGEWQAVLGRPVARFKFQVDGKTLGVMQIIKMPLPFDQYYFYCPYGPVLAEDGNFQFPISNFRKSLHKNFSDTVFVRIESKQLWLPATGYPLLTKVKNIQPGKTLVMDLTKTEEGLLAGMHHKTRYNIRLAEKHGVKVVDEFHLVNGKGIHAKEAVELIAKTSSRQGYKSQGQDYFENLVNFFAVQNPGTEINLHIYKALHENELLASAIILDFGRTRTYLFGGSSEQKKNLMAPYLLHFKAMQDAKNLGLSFYDFWGIETAKGDTPGFVRFKLGFGGTQKEYTGAYDIIVNRWKYRVYKLLRKVNDIFK